MLKLIELINSYTHSLSSVTQWFRILAVKYSFCLMSVLNRDLYVCFSDALLSKKSFARTK